MQNRAGFGLKIPFFRNLLEITLAKRMGRSDKNRGGYAGVARPGVNAGMPVAITTS